MAQSWVKRNTAWDLAEPGFWETLLPPGGGSQNDPMVGASAAFLVVRCLHVSPLPPESF